jgi:hypothetical protein
VPRAAAGYERRQKQEPNRVRPLHWQSIAAALSDALIEGHVRKSGTSLGLRLLFGRFFGSRTPCGGGGFHCLYNYLAIFVAVAIVRHLAVFVAIFGVFTAIASQQLVTSFAAPIANGWNFDSLCVRAHKGHDLTHIFRGAFDIFRPQNLQASRVMHEKYNEDSAIFILKLCKTSARFDPFAPISNS